MENSNLPKWLVSSTGEGLAMRAKAFLVGILPTVLIVSRLFGYTLEAQDANAIIDAVTLLLEGGVMVISAIYFVQGWVRANHFKRNKLGKFAE